MRNESWPELLSLAVHEFRSPAGVINGYLRMLQSDAAGPLNDRQRKMLSEAEKSCARLVEIVAEMSEISKLDDGRVQLVRKPLDLFAVADATAQTVHEAADRDVRLEVRGAAGGATILGDTARLSQAFAAVFRAILREQPASCTVVVDRRIETRDGASSAIIVVAQEQVATSESASVPFDEKRGGLGLVLPLAGRVIDGHGGRITSPSGAAERGAAIMSFSLPELSR